MQQEKRLILASNSPRRREILETVGVAFDVCVSDADESINGEADAAQRATLLSERKARAVQDRVTDDALIIAADTLVECDGEILGKPSNAADAARMLRLLSDRPHRVVTGFTVLEKASDHAVSDYVETTVVFRKLEDWEVEAYIRTGEPMDKAGAYGIQGMGCVFVKEIHGDFYNVVGLPAAKLSAVLSRDFGFRLLQVRETLAE